MALEPVEELTAASLRQRVLDLAGRTPVLFGPGDVPEGFKQAAVMIPLWEDRGTVLTALALRPTTLSSHSGQIAFPGGRFDETDADLRATALREANEEFAIDPQLVEFVVRLDDAWSIQRYAVAPFVAWLREPPTLVAAPAEVARLIVVPLVHVYAPEVHRTVDVERFGIRFVMHEYHLGDDRVWGLTGSILYGFWCALHGRTVEPESSGPETLRRFMALR